MCGILGIVGNTPVNQLLYDGLLLLQHRGQDAAGMVTASGESFYMHKGNGMVRDVFRTRHMRELHGSAGIGHVRYPTAGSADNRAEAQPFYVNSPYGIALAHNGNLTNADMLKVKMFHYDRRHINTNSDSEVLLNVLAHELSRNARGYALKTEAIFAAVSALHRRIRGAYAVVAMIAGYGMLAFRDPFGIRPLVIGRRRENGRDEYMVASESVALTGLGFELLRDVAPGECIYVSFDGRLYSQQCADAPQLAPCLFEYVYFARPDSVIDGVSVYQARLEMGVALAEKIRQDWPAIELDVVMPIPDTSRPSAMELAHHLGLPFREGFIRNRYISRTFIMPGQAVRKKSVRQKLNPMACEFAGKNILLVDDSIVRGTTSREIVQMAREAGAKKVYFASAAPAVRFPNVYGIDMPTRSELLANGRDDAQIADEIGADAVIYQDLNALVATIANLSPPLHQFESSCFNGEYLTGDVDEAYLTRIEQRRHNDTTDSGAQLVDLTPGINDDH